MSRQGPLDSSLEDLPLWPEALGGRVYSRGPSTVWFASDLDAATRSTPAGI